MKELELYIGILVGLVTALSGATIFIWKMAIRFRTLEDKLDKSDLAPVEKDLVMALHRLDFIEKDIRSKVDNLQFELLLKDFEIIRKDIGNLPTKEDIREIKNLLRHGKDSQD